MRRLLDETGNLIDLYMHHVGESEIPDVYHLWCCLSMIAATVADRVYTTKFRTSKITPLMYTILVGPSGSGKGEAIKTALRYVNDIPRINTYVGKTTGQHLVRYISKKGHAKIYLVNPELSSDVGSGGIADAFIKMMTKLWEGGDYGVIHEGTVTSKHVTVREPCINWLAGSTPQWLMESITPDTIHSGAFARIAVMWGERDYDKRMWEIKYPDDYEEIVDFIRARVVMMSRLEGKFEKAPEALEREHYWYMHRHRPDSIELEAAWGREHDISLKLAMIVSLAESDELVIQKHHMAAGQKLAADAIRDLPRLMRMAKVRPETEPLKHVEDVIKKLTRVSHSHLLRTTGMTSDQLRLAIETLKQAGQITRTAGGPRGGTIYVWVGGKRMPMMEEEEP